MKTFIERFLDRLPYTHERKEETRELYGWEDDGTLETNPGIVLTKYVLHQEDMTLALWRENPGIWQIHLDAYRGTFTTYEHVTELFWDCLDKLSGTEAMEKIRKMILDPTAWAMATARMAGHTPKNPELTAITGFATTPVRSRFSIPPGSEADVMITRVRDAWWQTVLNLIQQSELEAS